MPGVVSVNISGKKGTIKKPVNKISLDENGVIGDAHAGNWNRQVSLLGVESIEKFAEQTNREIQFGEFAENITTRGIVLYELHPLDRLKIGEALLEITQIGKKCHGTSCQIFKTTGDCVMPKEGVFARVLKKGEIIRDTRIEYIPKIFKVLVVTLSDRASRGEYEDKGGPLLEKNIMDFFKPSGRKVIVEKAILPDEKIQLLNVLKKHKNFDMVFTTGSTGIGPRDIAPDVIKEYIDKEITGIMEMIRVKHGAEKPAALLSRSIAGVKDKTLVFAIPGNPNAITEYTTEIFKTLLHSVHMVHALDIH